MNVTLARSALGEGADVPVRAAGGAVRLRGAVAYGGLRLAEIFGELKIAGTAD